MSDSTEVSLFDKSRRPFLLRKLHSLTGVVPVGVFLVVHLWTNSTALQGQERFDDAVANISHMPYLPLIEVFGILVPLAFHTLWGFKIFFEGKRNPAQYPYTRNWMYTFQRLTGLIAFLFLGMHLYQFWFQKVFAGMTEDQFYPILCASMSSTKYGVPFAALLYLVGVAASVFHFTNGLWGFCFSWGITISRRSQKMASVVFGFLGIVLFVLGANTVIYFATGSKLPFSGAEGSTHSSCAHIQMHANESGIGVK